MWLFTIYSLAFGCLYGVRLQAIKLQASSSSSTFSRDMDCEEALLDGLISFVSPQSELPARADIGGPAIIKH